MHSTLFTNIYIFVLASVLALLEIQIEGPNGWAKNLPTWRGQSNKWYSKLWMRLMSGKELTGYHLAVFSLVFLIFMLPFFLGEAITMENFLKNIILYFFFIPLWDFLWFVFNPHYPIKNFHKDNVVHENWLLGLPVDYYFSLAISLVITLIGSFVFPEQGFFHWWLTNLILFVIETCLVILFTINVLKIDNWKAGSSSFKSFRGQ